MEGLKALLPTPKWEIWTPDAAAEVLRHQEATFGRGANRHRRQTLVDKYAIDMRDGRWMPNGETVIFNGDRLLDGQHRLAAVAAAGISVPMLTVRGVSDDVMPTINTGLVRTPGDTLRGSIFPLVGGYYNGVAAAARVAWMYLKYGDVTAGRYRQPSRSELVAMVEQHRDVVESVKYFSNSRDTGWLRTKTTAAWHYLCGRRHPLERDAFFSDLVGGINLGKDRPVRLLRERMLAERGGRERIRAHIWSALIVKAWNAELAGRTMKLLAYRDSEVFPLLIGDADPKAGRGDRDNDVR